MVLLHALEVARPGRPPPRGDVDLEDRPDPLDDALGGALGRRKPDGQAFGDAPGEEGTLGVGLEGPDGVEQGDRRSEEHTSELQSLLRSSYAGLCLQKNTTTH